MIAAVMASLMTLQATPALSVETDACLRDNAVAVEQASGTLTEAVDFLATYLCAIPVAREATQARNAAYAEMMSMMPSSGGIPVSTELSDEDGEYAERIGPRGGETSGGDEENYEVTRVGPFLTWADIGTLSPSAVPVTVRQAAARYVLDARLARLSREVAE